MSEEQPQVEPTWPSMSASEPVEVVVASGPDTSTSGYAIAAFILSVVSWVVCPVICAIVALVLASAANKEIREAGRGGAGLTTAARIIAWVHLGVAAATILILVIVGIMVVASQASVGTA